MNNRVRLFLNSIKLLIVLAGALLGFLFYICTETCPDFALSLSPTFTNGYGTFLGIVFSVNVNNGVNAEKKIGFQTHD